MDRRLIDLGLVRGTRVTCVLKSPAGDPCAYLIRGALIALRRADADGVALERQVQETPAPAVAT
jgi:ferrous iron transport protein A